MPQVATGLRTRPTLVRARKRRVRLSTVRNAAAAFRPATLLVLAMWLGVATGFIELVVFYLRWRFVDATALSALQLNQHAALDGSARPCHDLHDLRAGPGLVREARSSALGGRHGPVRSLVPLGFCVAVDLSRSELDRQCRTGRWDRGADHGMDPVPGFGFAAAHQVQLSGPARTPGDLLCDRSLPRADESAGVVDGACGGAECAAHRPRHGSSQESEPLRLRARDLTVPEPARTTRGTIRSGQSRGRLDAPITRQHVHGSLGSRAFGTARPASRWNLSHARGVPPRPRL